jgi:hypothetical protein
MNINFRSLTLALLILGTTMPYNAVAQTRLGLHVTQEELNIWKQRAQSGPYKSPGDVSANSPGDWNRIVGNANAFISNPSVDRWAGQTTDQCVKAWDPEPPRNLGAKMRDAGFYYLVIGNTSYRDAVRNELLAQAGVAGTDFSNKTRWCASIWDDNPTFDYANWLTKLLFAYDYVRSGLTTSERNILDTWFLNAANFWEANQDYAVKSRFPNRNSDDYNTVGNCDPSGSKVTHFAGYTVVECYRVFNNRALTQARFFTLAGVMLNNTWLKNQGKRYVKEWIKYAVFPDGTPTEFERWENTTPALGWNYSSLALGTALSIADTLARTGDMELYNFSSLDGILDTKGGPKSLRQIITLHLKHVNTDIVRYGTDNSANNGSSAYRIRSIDGITGEAIENDTYTALANIFYQDNFIKSIYMRTAANSPVYPSSPGTGGWTAFTGEWGVYPGVLFMFGNMEGRVWPYSTGTQTPTVNLTANPGIIASGQSSTLTWSSTSATSCSASGGWTGTKATSGTQSVSPTQTTTYTVSCTGSGGNTSQNVTITVAASGSGPIPLTLANSSTLIADSNNFSSDYPRGPEKLWDGDTTTEDGSTGNSGISSFWVEFDFGKLYDLTKARLFGDAEGNWLCQTWALEYKQNQADTYNTGFTNTPCNGNQWFEQALSGTTARFVKLTVFGNPTIPATQARELEIYGTPASSPTPPTNLTITSQN